MKTITAYDNPALNSAITKSWKRLGATDVYFVLHRLYRQGKRGIRQRGDAGGYWALNSAFALGAGIFSPPMRCLVFPLT